MCSEFENSEFICKDFIQKCKEKELWNFDENQVMGSVNERLVYLYRFEIMMRKDSFKSDVEKARIMPYFPLISFPDENNKKYKIYVAQ